MGAVQPRAVESTTETVAPAVAAAAVAPSPPKETVAPAVAAAAVAPSISSAYYMFSVTPPNYDSIFSVLQSFSQTLSLRSRSLLNL